MSVLSAGEKKAVKKHSQTSRGVLVGQKIGFQPQKKYRPIPKKPNASSSGNKKKGVKPTTEVSNSNSFDVLNSVDNDVEFGTNGGTTNLEGKLRLLDNDGKSLVLTGIVESYSEVKVLFDEIANLRISMSGKDESDKGRCKASCVGVSSEHGPNPSKVYGFVRANLTVIATGIVFLVL
nr:hypothetical protein [Tanacetum cinerariifolium]